MPKTATSIATKLIHFSSKEVRQVASKAQSPEGGMKPLGFWVSDENDFGWKEWCNSTNYSHHKGSFAYQYEVKLADNARILYMSTANELETFDDKYHKTLLLDSVTEFMDHIYIRWDMVAKNYQGVIITPYIWELRLRMTWYYGWDCASGCIWDADAIESIRLNRKQRKVE